MAAKLGAQCGYGVVFAAILAAAIPTAASAETVVRNTASTPPPGVGPQTCCNVDAKVGLTLGVVSTLSIGKSFKTIAIGDPKVVDAAAQNDRAIILHPLANGSTNIIFFDEKDVPIITVGVLVSDAGQPSRVTVHNKALLGSYTVFRCGGDFGCQYVEELTVKEPAPLPRGYSTQATTNTDTNINTNAPAPPQ
jgi:Flp pilus assembly secretin CpaC